MKEGFLVVCFVNKRKYQPYRGEISHEVENIISRNFHTDTPNTKWLTDIAEFAFQLEEYICHQCLIVLIE